MKLHGEVIGEPEHIAVIFTRGEKDFVFMVRAVFDMEEFEKLCPEPTPMQSLKHGPVIDDAYKKRVTDHYDRRTSWVILQALSATDGLTWDEVDMEKPDTWELYQKELRESGLTNGELAHLITRVNDVNSVDEKKMEEARDRFSASQEAEEQPQ